MPFRALTLLLFFTIIETLVARWAAIHYHNNLPVYHVFVIACPLFFWFVYPRLLRASMYVMISKLLLGMSAAVSIANFVFNWQPNVLPSISINIWQLSLIVMALLQFADMLGCPDERPLAKRPEFWLNIGVLFYNALAFLFFEVINHFLHNPELSKSFVYINFILSIVSWLLFFAAIVLDARTAKK